MAAEWIKVEVSLPEKPEVMRMARILDCSRNEVLGLLVRFWIWADRSTVDGTVDAVVDADVDELVGRSGFAAALKEVRWLQSIDMNQPNGYVINIPKFTRHNGESAKKRALKNERQTKWRNGKVDDGVDARGSTNASTREEKRRYIKPRAALPPDSKDDKPIERWWESPEATLKRAKQLGIPTMGESWPALKQQIRDKEAAAGSSEKAA